MLSKSTLSACLLLPLLLMLNSPAIAAPVLDGTGFGAPTADVTYDVNAPTSNFGNPGTTTNAISYTVSMKSDYNYAYYLFQQTGTGTGAAGNFASLYFGTGSSIPTNGTDLFLSFDGAAGTATQADPASGHPPTQALSSQYYSIATLDGGKALEVAVAWDYFNTDPQNIGFTTTTAAAPDAELRLSQAFGYSVAGGVANYGPNDLGVLVQPSAPPPEPAGAPEIDAHSAAVPLTLCLGTALLLADRRRWSLLASSTRLEELART